MPDFDIIGPTPIIAKTQFYGKFQLEKGWRQHADTELTINTLSDLTTWFQVFASGSSYTYYNLDKFIISKIKSYGDDDVLYLEWFTFDTIQKNQGRTVMGFFDVLGYIGGI